MNFINMMSQERENELEQIKILRHKKQELEYEIEYYKNRINYLVFAEVHKEAINVNNKRKLDSQNKLDNINQQLEKKIKKIKA